MPSFIAPLRAVLNVVGVPYLEAPVLLVANLPAQEALDHFCFLALIGLVPDLVTFEAKLFIALKRIVGVLATQNTVHPAALIWTLARKMAKLFAVAAFDRWIGIIKVP